LFPTRTSRRLLPSAEFCENSRESQGERCEMNINKAHVYT
jgi:hypothetical protein